jgi:phosphoserine phosphatase
VIDAEEWKGSLSSWRDGSARRSVLAFLQEVTQGPDALPVADRVAAFDNDGTLACEKPHTALAGFLLDRLTAAGSTVPEVGGGHDVLRELGVLFSGRTTAQYEEQARRYLAGALHPRFHRPYPMLTYQPMLELMALLRALDFSVFMCTDSSRDFMRVIADPAYALRREQVIGSEVQIQAVDGRLVRTAIPVPMDDGPGKTVHLWDRTGTQPVLAAGNAHGDIAMLRAARFALVVHHDDEVREYAYDDPQILKEWFSRGRTTMCLTCGNRSVPAGREGSGRSPGERDASAAPAAVAAGVRSAPRGPRRPCQPVFCCVPEPTGAESVARPDRAADDRLRRRTITATTPAITSRAISPAMI